MKTSTSERKHGIQSAAWMQLDDLDFSDDLELLPHTHRQTQVKSASIVAVSVCSNYGAAYLSIDSVARKHVMNDLEFRLALLRCLAQPVESRTQVTASEI
ncbi:unnamed protein product [Schistosoma margrebowiei]|uniref:Uncharacterized protein n=1 Tax=Schistosoma margrebowiei TaxID=48269 RepID=A0A183MT93_9TREM|nr:unnamed protein product [Schistosoma margrebowiei]